MTMTAAKPKAREIRCDGLLWVRGQQEVCGRLVAVAHEDRVEVVNQPCAIFPTWIKVKCRKCGMSYGIKRAEELTVIPYKLKS